MSEQSFNAIVLVWLLLALIIIPVELKITAPYGRHSKKSWGPMVPNRLAWMFMECPSFLIFAYYFIEFRLYVKPIIPVFFGLWSIHYINRFLIYPLRQKTTGKLMPIAIAVFAICFNVMNGWVNAYYFAHFANYPIEYHTEPKFIFGVIIFVIGFILNNQSDTILIGLRKPGETGYKTPYGGLFKLVSCPNHLGEIIEWIGFAIMAWSLPSLSFAIWTAANLIPRALSHHRWYLEKFPDYPAERRAVLPYIL